MTATGWSVIQCQLHRRNSSVESDANNETIFLLFIYIRYIWRQFQRLGFSAVGWIVHSIICWLCKFTGCCQHQHSWFGCGLDAAGSLQPLKARSSWSSRASGGDGDVHGVDTNGTHLQDNISAAPTPFYHREATGFLFPLLFSAGCTYSFHNSVLYSCRIDCAAADMEDPGRMLRALSGVTLPGDSVQGAAGLHDGLNGNTRKQDVGSILLEIMTITDQNLDEAQAKLVQLLLVTLNECKKLFLTCEIFYRSVKY